MIGGLVLIGQQLQTRSELDVQPLPSARNVQSNDSYIRNVVLVVPPTKTASVTQPALRWPP
jgi:hypothetical protein